MEHAQPQTILIVDEDAALRDSLTFALNLEGYAVRTYATARDLLEDDSIPDRSCLVADQQRLVDMDGWELIRQMRSRSGTLPAILIISRPTEAARRMAAAARISIVEKPLTTGALFQRIDAAFR